ncbi:hypothetical protein JL722_14950 [Aureococcus anophagefferens]|nr:hypothetical protein JL722_14950 [Aureococcus anophagefferens]
MAEDATLLEGRKTKLELSKDATLCGTPKQQRNFIWVAFYALAITCGLVLRRASILEREATLDAAMDPSAWEIKVLNCANLRCHLSVKTSVAFPKAASFVVSYWPLDAAEYAVYSREHEVSSAATEVELYRLRPHTQYVARVRLKAEGFDKIVVVAEQTFESNAVGCNKFDNGPMVRIEGDPSFELLLFPYMDGETDSFRGLVAVDRAGYAVWYFNRTISAPGAHVEAFSQFTSMRDTAHFCVNDQNTVSVFVADAAGSVGATLLPEHVSNRTKNGTALESWTFMGHECRATRGGQIVTTGFARGPRVAVQLRARAQRLFLREPERPLLGPHDAVLDTVNGTQRLCLMDEGYFATPARAVESVDYYCYSRGVCYVLDAASGSASKAYDYSFPNNGVLSSLHLEAMDVFNKNGGDVDWTSASGGTSGLYRVLPITSVNGEGAHAPGLALAS